MAARSAGPAISVFALTTGGGTYKALRVNLFQQLERGGWGSGWGSPGDALPWRRPPLTLLEKKGAVNATREAAIRMYQAVSPVVA